MMNHDYDDDVAYIATDKKIRPNAPRKCKSHCDCHTSFLPQLLPTADDLSRVISLVHILYVAIITLCLFTFNSAACWRCGV